MPDQLFNERNYDLFVSYSHADFETVKPVVSWLEKAGLKVWWDSKKLLPGARLASALPDGLKNARAALFFVSQSWVSSTWCEDEFNAALKQRRADRRYQTITLHLDKCKVPDFLDSARYLEMPAFDLAMAALLLQALVPEPPPWVHGKRDIYLSRSWRPDESDQPDRVCAALTHDHGFRLIGDSPDHPDYDEKSRVQRIIESCGALVAVFPYRDNADHGFTSKYIVREASLANDLRRPFMLFAADGVEVAPALTASAVGRRAFALQADNAQQVLNRALLDLKEAYCPSPRTAYSFFTTSLRGNADDLNAAIDLMQQVTCMECLIGQDLQGQHAQAEIVDRIRHAEFVVADISDDRPNSLIEAGIARGAGVRLHLIGKIPESGSLHTRFMLRDIEVKWYRDDLERIGLLHGIARRYRRRVYNSVIAA
jgi:TIR domain-containing protein